MVEARERVGGRTGGLVLAAAPGVWTSYGEAWRAPTGRLHWAGAEYAPRWNGYMEGAVRSGEAAADAIAALG